MRKIRRTAFAWIGRLHIWIGWLVAVPLLLWTVSGLFMVSQPIETVRGEHLKTKLETPALPRSELRLFADVGKPVRAARLVPVGTRMVWIAEYADDTQRRFDARTGQLLADMTKAEARKTAISLYKPRSSIASEAYHPANDPPGDLRRPRPSWQIHFADGTNVYIDAETGEMLALRTRFWRAFDFMWGLHIMDLQTREDSSHPLLIVFAALSAFAVLLGTVLLFRRRRKRQ